jgi:uncharacterized protein with von Willebrand factor type A (vWA) domain
MPNNTPPTPETNKGGLVHSYQRFDPKRFPSPTAPPPDMASTAFEHMLTYGSMRQFTEEELANAVKIDPSQIAGLGPSLDALIAMLEERKRKILGTHESESVRADAGRGFRERAAEARPPSELDDAFCKAVREEQIRDLEQLWYASDRRRESKPSRRDETSSQFTDFARDLIGIIEALSDRYEVDELGARYDFTGRTPMTVDEALAIKEELETIDKLLEQLREAMKNAQLAVIDMEELAQFASEADVGQLRDLQEQIEEYVRQEAERQGLDRDDKGAFRLTPQAYKVFQGKLLQTIFSDLEAARSGRHQEPIEGEGAVELPTTRAYEFGDSATGMDSAQTLINAFVREGRDGARTPGQKVRVKPEDIEIHRTRNNPKCATVVLMDMSGSMRWGGQYVSCKRMALALDGLIRREYPGDFLRFIEMYSFAKPCATSEIAALMPKPVTIRDPVVRLRADMSDPGVTEGMVPPHFTNIQHGLRLARRFLASADTPNKQVVLISDGLPTAHFEDESLLLLYPPDPRTEEATMREARAAAREGVVINFFVLPSWSQSSEDVQFAHKLAETTRGRAFFTGGNDLDRFVLWDYVSRRRRVLS